MAAHLSRLAREAPDAARGHRPVASAREDLTTMVLALWPIAALLFDGRNHNNEVGQESFFSLAHIVLYLGMTVTAGWIGLLVLRHQTAAGVDVRKLVPDLRAIPVGYGVAILGLLLLGVAGPADLVWHTVYGFEVNVDAVYSPPHLALFFGGLLVTSTGIRSMWAKRDLAPDLRTFAPVVISAMLFLTVAGFITMYLSAFMTNVTPTSAFVEDLERFPDVHADQTIGLNPGLTQYGDGEWPFYYYATSHGIASMVVSTLVLLGPALLLLRRWRVPYGAFTLIFLGYGLFTSVMTEYRDAALIIPLVLTGLTLDVLQQRLGWQRGDRRVSLGGIRVVGPAAAAVLWCSYYLVMAVTDGIGWEPTLWVGALMVGIMTGFGVAFLIAPPSYGPRLVEGDAE